MFIYMYMFYNTGLPLSERTKQSSIFFVGASEKASIMDIGHLVVENIAEC